MPLSNHVAESRTADLSLDILEQVFSHMKACPLKISLQLNETADVSNCGRSMALMRYVCP